MEEKELVFKTDRGNLATNTAMVAREFAKEEKHVVESIDKLLKNTEVPDNQCSRILDDIKTMFFAYFEDVPQPNGGFKKAKRYIMNRDGFNLLVMGFTGKKALVHKVRFIQAFDAMEKALKDGQKKLSGAEYLLQQAQLMVEQERRLKTLENRMDNLDKEREENGRKLLDVKLSDERAPQQTMKSKIRELVNQYSSATNTSQQNVWHLVYKKLYYVYHISINSYHKLTPKESKLEVAERNGLLGKIFTIVSDLIRDTKAA